MSSPTRGLTFGLAALAAATGFAGTLTGVPSVAQAAVSSTIDPLHGYCGTGQCVDNGTNSPTTNNPPNGFGFTVSPGPRSGTWYVDMLLPNNEVSNPSSISFSLNGTDTGTATLFSSTAWSSGTLNSYLGFGTSSPTNPIGAYLPSTQGLDPGATGFYVYRVDFGTNTLAGASTPNLMPIENFASGESLPLASYIVSYLDEGGTTSIVATANSGAIFVTTPGTTPPSVPEPASLALFGTALAGLGLFGRRRRRS